MAFTFEVVASSPSPLSPRLASIADIFRPIFPPTKEPGPRLDLIHLFAVLGETTT